MVILRNIEISRFRSIRDSALPELEHFSALVGLNNSGKSNFLRALNLFFTGKPEPETSFDLARNYFRGELSAKKKKVISIAIHFTLPPSFNFRRELKPVETMLGRDFWITKEWTPQNIEPLVYLNKAATPLTASDVAKVNQFLALIAFRYVPNRVMPIEIIRKEQQALRDVLVRRLAKFKTQSAAVFNGLQSTAEALVQAVSEDINKFSPDIQKVRLATASSLADLAFQFGYRLSESGVEMDETEQGSGMQSLLMFETLHLIDRDYFQHFGWKQAALWAVEEPESSLNTALEARTAHFLARITNDKNGRLQIISTTHSDLMIQYSDRGYMIEKATLKTKFTETTATTKSAKDLLECASRYGVTRWVNPILLSPLDPVILVEGKFDRDFLDRIFAALNISPRPRVACLEDIKGDASKGGVETLITFILCEPLVQSRQPVLIEALGDPSSMVRATARLFLKQLGVDNVAAIYRQRLVESDTPSPAIIFGLSESGSKEDAPLIAKFLIHPKPSLRKAALISIGKLYGEAYTEEISQALMDPSPGVSKAAREVLTKNPIWISSALITETLAGNRPLYIRKAGIALIRSLPKWERIIMLLKVSDLAPEFNDLIREEVNRWLMTFNRNSVEPQSDQLADLRILFNQRVSMLTLDAVRNLQHIVDSPLKRSL
ncbi:AAA family ATPase [Oleiharenicola lentus]|uniref:AAA family ATPase n=1 Tax=Oleiharenicola lentus TaxID=2508720 RepID=UPI003F6777FE